MNYPSYCVPDWLELASTWGGCPKSDWEERAAASIAPANPVLLDVGANKGYVAATFLALFSNRGVDAQRWHKSLVQYARPNGTVRYGYLDRDACGACQDCRSRPPQGHSRSGGSVHLLEMLPSTRAILRHVISELSLGDIVSVYDSAASNETKIVPAPDALWLNYGGTEYASLQTSGAARRQRRSDPKRTLALTTVDDLMASRGLTTLYQVVVDTEGWDALVLEGMASALQHKRIEFVQFEHNVKKEYWRPLHREHRSLSTVVARLYTMGYTCFILARHFIAPISAEW